MFWQNHLVSSDQLPHFLSNKYRFLSNVSFDRRMQSFPLHNCNFLFRIKEKIIERILSKVKKNTVAYSYVLLFKRNCLFAVITDLFS